jgi:hypothetical protein
MADTTWAALNVRNSDLIFKALGGGFVAIAPIGTTLPTAITATSGAVIQTLPAGYEPLGWLEKATGAEFEREINTEDVESWGAREPTRTDIISDIDFLNIVAQETNIRTMSLDLGIALDALEADATTGEVVLAKPELPAKVYYRAVVFARDSKPGGDAYFARSYARVEVVERTAQKWADAGDPIKYGLKFKSYFDTTAGYSVKNFWGGPGFKALLTAMDIPNAA